MTITVTVGGTEYPLDFTAFIKMEAGWPHIIAVRDCFARRDPAKANPDNPEGFDPDIINAINEMRNVCAIASTDIDALTKEAEIEAAFVERKALFRMKIKRDEVPGIRAAFVAISEDAQLSGKDDGVALMVEAAPDPKTLSTETSTAS